MKMIMITIMEERGGRVHRELWRETLNARGRDIIEDSQFMAVVNLRMITKRCWENLSKGERLSLTRHV